MTVNSMTGFARSQGTHGDFSWHWELRSVNGRGLDARLRLPTGFEALEQDARKALNNAFSRGNVSATLTAKRTVPDVEIHLDEKVLEQVLVAVEKIRALTNAPAPTAEGLINTRGVLDIRERSESEETLKQQQAAIMAGLTQAITDLQTARSSEGGQLKTIILAQLKTIEEQVGSIRETITSHPQKISDRLKQQINVLLSDEAAIQPERLHQEIAIILTKADISEEVDRIDAHLSAGRELLEQDGPIGRKLDFLTQEFNREANTICSKSNDIAVTRDGLAMKAAIDQMREQVQNVE
ncbi:MAG: YicC/YloC family endoribonuclease [Pseudomonadota bacterium]